MPRRQNLPFAAVILVLAGCGAHVAEEDGGTGTGGGGGSAMGGGAGGGAMGGGTGGGAADAGTGGGAADAGTDGGTAPSLSISGASVPEGNAGTTTLLFTVTLSAAAASPVTADFTTIDGTATTGSGDYGSAQGTVTLAPGDTSKTVQVLVTGDLLDENDETLGLALSNPVNASLATASATGTITDDDLQPSLSVADVSVSEGNAGTAAAVFTVTLSEASGRAVTVLLGTVDGVGLNGAVAPGDYAEQSAVSLAFAPGETVKRATVLVAGDTAAETDEAFTVELSAPTNATLSRATAVGTILDDDGVVVPRLSIGDASLTEGNSGTAQLTFAVTLDRVASQPVTVNYATQDGTGASGATSQGAAASGGLDLEATSGTLTFSAGEVSKSVTVTVSADLLDEPDETFTVLLSGAVNAVLARTSATGTIVDDDPAPQVSVASASGAEGQAGVRALTFTASLSAASARAVSVAYASADGAGASGATAGGTTTGANDYTSAVGTINFAPGVTTAGVSVVVNGDTLNEADEALTLTLSSPVNATLAASAVASGTITNDDPLPLVVVGNASVTEGNSGSTTMTFTVSLRDGAGNPVLSGRPVSVDFATEDGPASGGATVASADFVATSGTLTFAPGQSTQLVTVTVNGDTVAETNETLVVRLSNVVSATILTATGVGQILDDDRVALFVSINDAQVTEVGTGATSTLTFTVSLSQPVPTGETVTVDYATADGTAAASVDYTASAGTLTFAAGQQSQVVTVTVLGDGLDEGNETLTVALTNPSMGALIQAGVGTGTIDDDDPLPGLAISSRTGAEGDTGTTTATFTVTLAAASGRPVTVAWATANGSAQAGGTPASGGADYVAASGTLTFATGETSKPLGVTVNGDTTFEGQPGVTAETFVVTLSGATNASIVAATGTGTITNDDAQPSLSIDDVTALEGSAPPATTTFAFTVRLSGLSAQTVAVSYGTSSVGATNPATGFGTTSDYTPTSGTLTFAPGETAKTVTVSVRQDVTVELNETFFVNLSNAMNANPSDNQGLGTITNDD